MTKYQRESVIELVKLSVIWLVIHENTDQNYAYIYSWLVF